MVQFQEMSAGIFPGGELVGRLLILRDPEPNRSAECRRHPYRFQLAINLASTLVDDRLSMRRTGHSMTLHRGQITEQQLE